MISFVVSNKWRLKSENEHLVWQVFDHIYLLTHSHSHTHAHTRDVYALFIL